MGPASKFCVPNGVTCLSVVFNSGSARCTSQLCTQRASNTSTQKVECPDNMHNCPFESTCNATSSSCFCNIGRATFDCSDQPCTSGCAGGTYWCAPDLTTFDCNSDLDGAAVTCKCWDGTQKTVTCNDNVSGKSCEDLCAGR
jgi:hypothetical protein